MNVRFYLKDKKAASSSVRVVITHNGKVYRKALGISLPTRQWKASSVPPMCSTNPEVNKRLKAVHTALLQRLDEYSTRSEILKALEQIGDGEVAQRIPFQRFFDEWSERAVPAVRQRRNVRKLVGSLMGRNDEWEDVDASWLRRLCDKLDAKGYSANFKANIISRLKTVLSEGFDRGYHSNDAFKGFRKRYESAEAVWLTADEIERLWSLPLEGREANVRDLFIVGVYTASRFSDYSRLDETMIEDGIIHFVQQKTHEDVLIPCAPRVAEILARHGGRVPKMSQQELNREIKAVCEKAKIDEAVTLHTTRGGARVPQTEPKYKFVSSHTARRTAATQMALKGTPMRSIAMVTGHKHLSSLETYLKMSKTENALLLKENDFFK